MTAIVVTHAEVLGIAAVCAALGMARASFYRWLAPQFGPRRPRISPRALSADERQQVLDVLHEDRFMDLAPSEGSTVGSRPAPQHNATRSNCFQLNRTDMNTFRRPACAFAFLLSGASALAQTPPTNTELAARHELLQRAQDAANTGHHAEALDFAQRAGAINMTPSLEAFIGLEHRALGQLAEAMGGATACIRDIEHNPTVPQREAVLSSCRALARDLAPLVGHVTVRVPHVEGLRVRVASADLNAAFFGLPYIVTPGAVVVEGSAPRHEPFRQTVTVSAGGTVEVAITLHERAGAMLGAQHPADTSTSTHPDAADRSWRSDSRRHQSGEASPVSSRSGSPVAPIIVTGIGVVTLGVALVVNLAVADPAFSSFQRQYCDAPTMYVACHDTPAARQQYNSAAALDTATWVTIGIGGAIAVGGLLWLALAPRSRTEQVHPVASATLDGTMTLGVRGAL